MKPKTFFEIRRPRRDDQEGRARTGGTTDHHALDGARRPDAPPNNSGTMGRQTTTVIMLLTVGQAYHDMVGRRVGGIQMEVAPEVVPEVLPGRPNGFPGCSAALTLGAANVQEQERFDRDCLWANRSGWCPFLLFSTNQRQLARCGGAHGAALST